MGVGRAKRQVTVKNMNVEERLTEPSFAFPIRVALIPKGPAQFRSASQKSSAQEPGEVSGFCSAETPSRASCGMCV
jgi:hypothetical protein